MNPKSKTQQKSLFSTGTHNRLLKNPTRRWTKDPPNVKASPSRGSVKAAIAASLNGTPYASLHPEGTLKDLGWQAGNKLEDKTPFYGSMAGAGLGALLGGGIGAGAQYLRGLFSDEEDEEKKPSVSSGALIGALAGGGLGGFGGHSLGKHVWDKTQQGREGYDQYEAIKNVKDKFRPSLPGSSGMPQYLTRPAITLATDITRPARTLATDITRPIGAAAQGLQGFSGLFGKKSSYQPKKAAKSDHYGAFEKFLQKIKNDPDTTPGSMIVPASKLSQKEVIKAAFLLAIAEKEGLAGLELGKLEAQIDKQASIVGTGLGKVVGMGTNIATGAMKTIMDLGLTGAIAAPVLTGGLAGYGYSKLNRGPDPEELKHRALQAEYLRMATEIKQKGKIRQAIDEDPSSVVQLT